MLTTEAMAGLAREIMIASHHSHVCCNLVHTFERCIISESGGDTSTGQWCPQKLSQVLVKMTSENSDIACYKDLVVSLQSRLDSIPDIDGSPSTSTGHFVWRDRVLVDAMWKDKWVENVNLCPASVLDRLNSVTEPNGTLLLSESGSFQDGSADTHRIIVPHENFRIFLTMDPSHGEISRAMRTRCVEISVIHENPPRSSKETTELHMTDMHRECNTSRMPILDDIEVSFFV